MLALSSDQLSGSSLENLTRLAVWIGLLKLDDEMRSRRTIVKMIKRYQKRFKDKI